jgi:pilus assembly protein Flp/PilA
VTFLRSDLQADAKLRVQIQKAFLYEEFRGPQPARLEWCPRCFRPCSGKQAPVPFTLHQEREIQMKNMLARLWKEEEGQDLTEYALLLVLVALAAIGSLGTLATAINNVFSSAASNLNT